MARPCPLNQFTSLGSYILFQCQWRNSQTCPEYLPLSDLRVGDNQQRYIRRLEENYWQRSKLSFAPFRMCAKHQNFSKWLVFSCSGIAPSSPKRFQESRDSKWKQMLRLELENAVNIYWRTYSKNWKLGWKGKYRKPWAALEYARSRLWVFGKSSD